MTKGERLRLLRKAHGYILKEMEVKLGKAKCSIQKAEHGDIVDENKYLEYCDALEEEYGLLTCGQRDFLEHLNKISITNEFERGHSLKKSVEYYILNIYKSISLDEINVAVENDSDITVRHKGRLVCLSKNDEILNIVKNDGEINSVYLTYYISSRFNEQIIQDVITMYESDSPDYSEGIVLRRIDEEEKVYYTEAVKIDVLNNTFVYTLLDNEHAVVTNDNLERWGISKEDLQKEYESYVLERKGIGAVKIMEYLETQELQERLGISLTNIEKKVFEDKIFKIYNKQTLGVDNVFIIRDKYYDCVKVEQTLNLLCGIANTDEIVFMCGVGIVAVMIFTDYSNRVLEEIKNIEKSCPNDSERPKGIFRYRICQSVEEL